MSLPVRLAALFRFGIGGLLSSAVAVGITALLHEAGEWDERVAAAAGLAAALVVNFGVLRYYVFRGTHVPFTSQLVRFLGSSGIFRMLEYGAFLLLAAFTGIHYLVTLVLVLGVSFGLKFFVYDSWVFSRSHRQ